MEQKSPAIIIVDRLFKIRKELKMFKNISREIFIFTQTNNNMKEIFFKKIGVKIIKLKKTDRLKDDVSEVFFQLKQLGFNRILVESGIKYINVILRFNLISNFYLFKSPYNLKNNGKNNAKSDLIKKLKDSIKNKIKVNLNGDSLYKIQL